jgi:hypothetical protein
MDVLEFDIKIIKELERWSYGLFRYCNQLENIEYHGASAHQ